MSKFLVNLTAAVFVLYGIGFALSPKAMSELVTGGSPMTASGMIDLRSTYGGLSLAVGVCLFFLARSQGLLPLGLRAVAIIMGAMASTRVIGFVVDGPPDSMMWTFLAAEITALSLSMWQIRIERRRGSPANMDSTVAFVPL